jgi:hypothetical protein
MAKKYVSKFGRAAMTKKLKDKTAKDIKTGKAALAKKAGRAR